MRSPVLPPMRMNAAETSASSAMAPCTPLTVVPRSSTTAEIETFISDVSTTSTNIAIARSSASRPLNGTARVASASMAHPSTTGVAPGPPEQDETAVSEERRSAELAREAVDVPLDRGDLDVREPAVGPGQQHRLVGGAQGVPDRVGLALERGAQRPDLVPQAGPGDDLDRRLNVGVRVGRRAGRRGGDLDLGDHPLPRRLGHCCPSTCSLCTAVAVPS